MISRKSIAAVILAAMGSLMAGSALASGNVCQDQVNSYAREQLGWDEFTTEIVYAEKGRPGLVGVKRPHCKYDEYIIRIRATKSTCTNVHYGRIPNYILGGYWTGHCN